MSAPGKVWRVEQWSDTQWEIYESWPNGPRIATFTREADARAVVEAHNARRVSRPLFTSPPSQIAKVRALRARYIFAALDSVYSESLSAKVDAADEIIKLLEGGEG